MPTVPKIADFLLYLRTEKKLSVSAIKGYRSMLAAVFGFNHKSVFESQVLTQLIRSFAIEVPRRTFSKPSWDLDKVLSYLASDKFQDMGSISLDLLTKKTLFLVALATAKRLGELQAVSSVIATNQDDFMLSYLPEFLAKTETSESPVNRVFRLKSLSSLVGNERERTLCPVRALKFYLDRVKSQSRPRNLFVSVQNPSRPMTRGAMSFFLRSVIIEADAINDPAEEGRRSTGPHSIRGVSTSAQFLRNMSVATVLETACWKSSSVFTTFYLKDVQFSSEGVHSLGPFVAAGGFVT